MTAVSESSWASIVGRRLEIDVPASSANLGAGYDCLGLAIELLNRVSVEATEGDGSIELEVTGEGARGPRPAAIGWRVAMHNRIPLSRGLGSSAAATVGGVVAGNALGGGGLPSDELLRIATLIETHPDTAAAVLLGGFVVSAHLAERRLSTEDMRRVLPAEVPLRHAVENLGRVAIGVAGIARGQWDLLADLTVDRLHEPYRSVPYPELPRLTGAAREAGALGSFLSGAGSTILAFVRPGGDSAPIEAALRDEAAACGLAGRVEVVTPRNRGPEVIGG